MSKVIGINTRSVPTQESPLFLSPMNVEMKVVLVEGAIGDYACYVGIGSTEWVAAHGDKLRFQEAQCHFPLIEEEKYRR